MSDLAARVAAWRHDPVAFPHDVMRWEDKRGKVCPLELEPYQQDFMRAENRFRGVNKSRQVGFSFLFAVESVTRAILDPGHTSMFVSYNQDDAREKINYVHKLYEYSPALQALGRWELLKDQARVRVHGSRQWSLIRSLPCKPVRGKTKADLYLDELAHYEDAHGVYLGSVPATVRSTDLGGQITVASTPNGCIDVFWECMEGPLAEKYWKQVVPWWHSIYLCKDVPTALREAPHMPTWDRVAKFGLRNLQDLFDGMALPDFQQEFEAEFIDEGASYYPMDLIAPCLCDHALSTDMREVLQRRQGRLYAGYDVGRFKDNSEFVVIDRFFDGSDFVYVPLMIRSFDRVSTEEQEREIARLLAMKDEDGVPLLDTMWIDNGGMGLPIAEGLKLGHRNGGPFWEQVRAFNFSVGSKEQLAVMVRRIFERRLIDLPHPSDQKTAFAVRQAKELVDQIHSIKRTPLSGRHARYEAVSTTHHGDQFWAMALALCCAADDLGIAQDVEQVRVLG